jgi:hypothetical protein
VYIYKNGPNIFTLLNINKTQFHARDKNKDNIVPPIASTARTVNNLTLHAVSSRCPVELVQEVQPLYLARKNKINLLKGMTEMYLFLPFLLKPSFGFQFLRGQTVTLEIPHKKENRMSVAMLSSS